MPEPEVTPQPTPEPTPEPQPEPTPEPTVVPNWYDSFSDETLKKDESITKYKTFDDFGKAFKEKDSMIGRKGVILPNENDPKDLDRFYNQLGRPETPDKYESPKIEIEENLKQFYSEERLDKFKETAHKLGLTQKQFNDLTTQYTQSQMAEIKNIFYEQNKKVEDSTRALMQDWLTDYDANSRQAELAIKSLSEGVAPETIELMLQNPDIKRIAFNMSKVISEDTLKRGVNVPTDNVQTLQAFIDSQTKVSDSSYYNVNAPDHKATKEKVKEAYAKLEALRKVG